MATGIGKTTVMGVPTASSIPGYVSNRSYKRFPDVVMIVCPNVTIRNGFEELKPQCGVASLYRTRDPYLPDSLASLAGGRIRHLILETKGYGPMKDVKTQAAQRWVRAVNANGSYGSWMYDVVSDMSKVGEAVGRAAG